MREPAGREPHGAPLDVLAILAAATHVWLARAAVEAVMAARAGAMTSSTPDIAVRVAGAAAAVALGVAAFVHYRRRRSPGSVPWLLAAAVVAPVCAVAGAYGGALGAMRLSSPVALWPVSAIAALVGACVPYAAALWLAAHSGRVNGA